ncbi:fatty-acid peroxygenase [Actinopolyspora biskrensis]|uniref:Fatty-acid peroxygenase n=1 Tax=Actinopolyspora biskrensis TaxID=1470178 RepID=A0A852Z3H3_9ACTN|nr:cytochrome P450 [Actinopolyspora biskrensis]NYH80309.1 fatty-acid peroxygenase [Actinopolyspora biskrensis]
MKSPRVPVTDSTLAVLTEGYAWLPSRWNNAAGPLVRTRLLGQRAVGLRGPEAVRLFYDEQNVSRSTAVPEPVLSTLFGHEAVHTLDGPAHRTRRAIFGSLVREAGSTNELVEAVTAAWDEESSSWRDRPGVVLFDEASSVLTRGVCRWAGIPLSDDEVRPTAHDLVSLVDGFATGGPRHWRARSARRRQQDRLARLIEDVRSGRRTVPRNSAVDVVARHHDSDGTALSPRVAAVELLNVIRPTVAVCWFLTFAAHALHRWPAHREPLGADDPARTEGFVQEVRRFYPFAPFVGGRAVRDLSWHGEPIPAGTLVLLDLYGQNHDPALWKDPYAFDPRRFLDRPVDRDELVPQGGGDPDTSHRCPGEDATRALLRALVPRLARLEYEVPEQDLTISLRRLPARPRSGFVIESVHPPKR